MPSMGLEVYKMIELAPADKCSGCMACAAACPANAISIRMDALGNTLPELHPERCVRCGKCRRICPVVSPLPAVQSASAYAVWSLDPQNRSSSASGGAAAEFYAAALEQGAWICGAEYTPDMRVIHTLHKDASAIQGYKQSKYVYSETGDVYRQIKEKLDAGEQMLMISLPCKIAGLLGYLGRPYEGLVTVDIVCHGTPPQQMLWEHISQICPGLSNAWLSFRQDNSFIFRLTTDGKEVYRKVGRTDTYLAAFLEGLNYREACYHCSFAKQERVSDLTICDFWGLGTELPFAHPYTGSVSAVLVNTPKGRSFFEGMRDALFVEERPVSEAVNGNAQLKAPTIRHPDRDRFEALYHSKGFDGAVGEVLRKEMRTARWSLLQRRLRNGLRSFVKSLIKHH